MGKKSDLSILLIGAALLAVGTAAYFYLNNVLKEEDIDLDLSEEDESAYL